MLVPRSQSEYDVYADARRNLATAHEDLLAINPLNSLPADYGLHPELTNPKSLFDSGKLSLIGNVGTLIEPTLQSDYVNKRVELPPQLFSHNDQQNFVMSLQATQDHRVG